MLGIGFGLTSEGSLRRAGGAPAWTPLDLGATLKCWWSADDHGTARMTDDGAGLISSWTDKVGGLALTGTTTARPTWSATSFNSAYAGLTFDGTANQLGTTTYSAFVPTGATAGNLIMLVNCDVVVANQRVFGYGNDITARSLSRTLSGSMRHTLSTEAANLVDTAVVFSGIHISVGEWAGTTMTGWLDGAPTTPPSGAIATLNTPSTGGLRIGARQVAATLPWKGIGRHFFATTQLTTLQRQQLEGWMAWDVALASLLPVGHPYKSARP